MDGRFSLLLLEPGEIYFEDFSAVLITPDTTPNNFESKKQIGRLKMCSKSLVFDPKDITFPLIKIPFKDCQIIDQWKGKAKFLASDNVLSVKSKQHVEMLEGNIIAPYNFRNSVFYLFLLNYANISDCLSQLCQLHRASTLPAAEQADMIATIVHSRHARVKFDPLWLDLYEKIITEALVNRVSPLVVNPGRVVLSTGRLYFQPYNNIEEYPILKIHLNSIKKVVKRRFLLRHVGLEIYANENNTIPHIYLSFRTQSERDNFVTQLLSQPEILLTAQEQDVMTLQWQNGILSNYDYLIYINSLADRTINDLTQYPVFPWVISDYSSTNLDLNDPKSYRDLSKPIGALNEERLQRLMDRYEEMSIPKFIYGSHYSTPGFVLFYIVRLYPHYMLCLQNGRFDHPDRMFNSVADVYKNCLNNMSDFKELIPEFYDTEQEGKFLVNNLGINFGYRHDGVKVGDVQLPPWAESPTDFVKKLREALESDHVSENLHSWIDLIFGYKQRGDEAVNAKNLFYYLCYEGKVDLDSITDLNQRHALEVQIMEFGQIPRQVFKVPHPKRKTKNSPAVDDAPTLESKEINDDRKCSWKNIEKLEMQTCFNTHKDSVSSVTVTEDSTKIISVGFDSKLKVFSLIQNRQIRSANIGTMPLSSCIQLPNKNVMVIGSWDNNIIVYDLDFGREIENLLAHEDAVTCMAWGNKCQLLVSGSGDCTIRIWKGFLNKGAIRATQSLVAQLDHNSLINCVCFNAENTYLASGTEDGEIYVWDIKNQHLLKKLCVHTGSVKSLSFSPDGQKLVSCGADKIFQVVDLNTGMALFYKTLPSSLKCLKWENNILLLGSDDGTLYVWDLVEVKLLYQMKAHKGPICCVDFAPNKEFIVTGGEDHHIRIWRPSSQNK